MPQTILQVINFIKETLKTKYNEQEIKVIYLSLLKKFSNIEKSRVLAFKETVISDFTLSKIKDAVLRLKNSEPLDYITGEVEFCNVRIKVNNSVLIPRPETEELVGIVKSYAAQSKIKNIKILEIGAGSGCISVALKKMLPHSEIYATDICSDALSLASYNANKNKVNINFIKHDILNDNIDLLPAHIDILVSNPPYVLESEKDVINDNVLKFEPYSSLFVNNNNPLLFYEKMIKLINLKFKNKDVFFAFEINPLLEEKLLQLCNTESIADVRFVVDIFGKKRFLCGRKFHINERKKTN